MKASTIFCKNIKYYRLRNNFSQEKLGELTDLSTRYISAIECGRYSPTIDTMEKLAKALEIETYLLFKELDNYEITNSRVDVYRKKLRENCKDF